MMSILKDLEASGRIEYIPQLWSDIKIFDHTSRENLLLCLLDIMVDSKADTTAELTEKFSEIAWDIYTFVTTQPEERTKVVR